MGDRNLSRSEREALSQKGWVVLRDVSRADFNTLTDKLATRLYDSDIKLDTTRSHFVTKPSAIPYHCDSPRAQFIAWYCVSTGRVPVPLKLIDTWTILKTMDQDTVSILRKTRLGFNCRITNQFCSMPVVSVAQENDNDQIVFFNPWNIPKNLSLLQQTALKSFEQSLKHEPPTRVNLRLGDVLIIDNHRIVHGRDALEESTDRHLIRRLMEDADKLLPIRAVSSHNIVASH